MSTTTKQQSSPDSKAPDSGVSKSLWDTASSMFTSVATATSVIDIEEDTIEKSCRPVADEHLKIISSVIRNNTNTEKKMN